MGDECHEALEELSRYLDRECTADLEAAIRLHLADCPPCLDRAAFEEALRSVLARRCRDRAPEGLAVRIIAEFKQR